MEPPTKTIDIASSQRSHCHICAGSFRFDKIALTSLSFPSLARPQATPKRPLNPDQVPYSFVHQCIQPGIKEERLRAEIRERAPRERAQIKRTKANTLLLRNKLLLRIRAQTDNSSSPIIYCHLHCYNCVYLSPSIVSIYRISAP